ncbi:flagellar hook assembly protein FlgD [Conexibacter sp. SYSU D00693]|uniref:flagellar hook assembly protein FlgD n=1 Tax=Conexibacter sp. SYSU D00693 TaxID=2812560 RepID=UPI00196ADE1B|nr:flagellar hook capping FlgD N-terminal domain-containing protein [Conexibacter sp. SYSU D00693]
MPSVSGIDPTQTTSRTGSSKPSQTLDKQAFLRLFVEQLKNQDPTAPQDLSAQMAQVSQMTMVEQITSLTQATEATHAQSLIGRTVTYVEPTTGEKVTGKVESVDVSESAPKLTIAGKPGIATSTVVEVR